MFAKILDGIKVVDVTAWAFVPSAAGVLAHWGADVVKVESTTAPDPMRRGNLEPGRSAPGFKHYSRGKKSVAINLATPAGQELIYRLAADADVFLTSYLPATRRKLKMDVEDIRAVNPNIIYVRGSGYGPKGPDAERPGYDHLSWWYRGSLAQSAMDAADVSWPPNMSGHGDGISGLVLAGGICAALLQRERTGVASVVDSSLMGTAVWFQGMALLGAQAGEGPAWKFGPVERPKVLGGFPGVSRALMSTYQTKDYRFLSLCFLGDADSDFVDLCTRLERPDLANDARFVHVKERIANSDALLATPRGVLRGEDARRMEGGPRHRQGCMVSRPDPRGDPRRPPDPGERLRPLRRLPRWRREAPHPTDPLRRGRRRPSRRTGLRPAHGSGADRAWLLARGDRWAASRRRRRVSNGRGSPSAPPGVVRRRRLTPRGRRSPCTLGAGSTQLVGGLRR